MTAFTRVNVVSDTPEWEDERRNSIGASEVPAIMGLSPYATALDIYKAKRGVDKYFDPQLAFYGHESEAIIHKWVEKFSGLDVELHQGFMARSADRPHMHASFDRVSNDPFLTWQFKTSSAYAGHSWDEGIPTAVRVQVNAEMYVAGTTRSAVVVWIGGREMRVLWEPRDDRFINEHMLPAVDDFWDRVQAGEPPEPSTMGELAEVWPSEAKEAEVPEFAIEALEKRAFLLASVKEMTEEADQIKLAVGQWMQQEGVDTLTRDGRKFVTYKKQKGRESLDTKALRADHPELVTEYTKQGADFLVMRTHAPKEKNNV